MKTQSMQLVAGMVLAFLIGTVGGMNIEQKKADKQDELIEQQAESVELLKERLQTSNEKRGRLFMALLYTDVKGKEAALDSLIIEIGKDN